MSKRLEERWNGTAISLFRRRSLSFFHTAKSTWQAIFTPSHTLTFIKQVEKNKNWRKDEMKRLWIKWILFFFRYRFFGANIKMTCSIYYCFVICNILSRVEIRRHFLFVFIYMFFPSDETIVSTREYVKRQMVFSIWLQTVVHCLGICLDYWL